MQKYQTEVGDSFLLLPENIEKDAVVKGKKQKEQGGLVFAPAEDQIPQSILKENNPFVLYFPSMFPDGKGGLHDPVRNKKSLLKNGLDKD